MNYEAAFWWLMPIAALLAAALIIQTFRLILWMELAKLASEEVERMRDDQTECRDVPPTTERGE